jgi:hypothetical protein
LLLQALAQAQHENCRLKQFMAGMALQLAEAKAAKLHLSNKFESDKQVSVRIAAEVWCCSCTCGALWSLVPWLWYAVLFGLLFWFWHTYAAVCMGCGPVQCISLQGL